MKIKGVRVGWKVDPEKTYDQNTPEEDLPWPRPKLPAEFVIFELQGDGSGFKFALIDTSNDEVVGDKYQSIRSTLEDIHARYPVSTQIAFRWKGDGCLSFYPAPLLSWLKQTAVQRGIRAVDMEGYIAGLLVEDERRKEKGTW